MVPDTLEEAKTVPEYKKEDVRSIVQELYEAGMKAKANGICDAYARKGNPDMLRDLYEKHN